LFKNIGIFVGGSAAAESREDGFDPMMELVAGTFTRRAERGVFAPSHPLNLL
jgi:hypothetical protein